VKGRLGGLYGGQSRRGGHDTHLPYDDGGGVFEHEIRLKDNGEPILSFGAVEHLIGSDAESGPYAEAQELHKAISRNRLRLVDKRVPSYAVLFHRPSVLPPPFGPDTPIDPEAQSVTTLTPRRSVVRPPPSSQGGRSRLHGSMGPKKGKEGATLPQLRFESHFESGNLSKAVMIFPEEYDLLMSTDSHSEGHTQWFYFSIENAVPGVKYRFNIVNFRKKKSIWGRGMQPLMYAAKESSTLSESTLEGEEEGAGDEGGLKGEQGWHHVGEDVTYTPSSSLGVGGSIDAYGHSLGFTVTFPHKGKCYLASGIPYTHSNLMRDMDRWEYSPHCEASQLCITVAGTPCPLLTITAGDGEEAIDQGREVAVFTGRVHPGETCASWMIRGLIDFLVGASEEAEALRKKFVFKVIPMLNPDGVILGKCQSMEP